jgi:hypothetical protein
MPNQKIERMYKPAFLNPAIVATRSSNKGNNIRKTTANRLPMFSENRNSIVFSSSITYFFVDNMDGLYKLNQKKMII